MDWARDRQARRCEESCFRQRKSHSTRSCLLVRADHCPSPKADSSTLHKIDKPVMVQVRSSLECRAGGEKQSADLHPPSGRAWSPRPARALWPWPRRGAHHRSPKWRSAAEDSAWCELARCEPSSVFDHGRCCPSRNRSRKEPCRPKVRCPWCLTTTWKDSPGVGLRTDDAGELPVISTFVRCLLDLFCNQLNCRSLKES